MDVFGPTKQIGTVFNGPKNSAWAVRGQLPPQPRFHFFGIEIHGHFRPHNTQNHNLHTSNAYRPITVGKSIPGLAKTVPNFQNFGHKFWDRPNGHSQPHTTQTINKALKPKNKPSRRRPLPSGVCRNSSKPVPTLRGATLLLASPETNGLIARNSRENVEFLSLKNPTLFSLLRFPLLPLSLLLSQPIWSRLRQETCHLNATCPILSGSWDYTLSSYPTTLRFSSNGMMACVHPWPTLVISMPCLTNFAQDTWHSVSYSKCAKCSALPMLPRKT